MVNMLIGCCWFSFGGFDGCLFFWLLRVSWLVLLVCFGCVLCFVALLFVLCCGFYGLFCGVGGLVMWL